VEAGSRRVTVEPVSAEKFPWYQEKYRESIGGAVHALKSSTLDEIAEQKCSEEQGISDRITGKQILKTGKLFVLL
jgi:hypothetical protein